MIGTKNSWLAISSPNPQASLRLFCFPYAGGDVRIFRKWLDYLPTFVEVVPVQLPGRANRIHEPAFTRLQPLVEAIAHVITPYLDKPFAFFGHSMGAMISFELARQLRRRFGMEPVHMFVSGRRAPQLPDTTPPTYDLPGQEFLEELRRLNGTPKEVLEHPELMELVVPLLRADFSVVQTYAYSEAPPLNNSITAFGGIDDTEVSQGQQEAWREQTVGPFSLHMLPGDHFFLFAAERIILRIISERLRSVAVY